MAHGITQTRPGETWHGEYIDLIKQPDTTLVIALNDGGRDVFDHIEATGRAV